MTDEIIFKMHKSERSYIMYTLSIYLYSDKYQTPNPGAGVCQQINA